MIKYQKHNLVSFEIETFFKEPICKMISPLYVVGFVFFRGGWGVGGSSKQGAGEQRTHRALAITFCCRCHDATSPVHSNICFSGSLNNIAYSSF